ncbi:MAG: acylneuraminate cytidylyltransferase family protein [Lachnospiraceae bacterium]|nr:acylneuraminate cytidylyltransferase family protein [Lachnospiraceae bacterium]
MKDNSILAIIPARSGSKSVVDKNIRLIDGKPMLAYSIDHAKQSRYIGRVLVSTDSEKYAEIAKEYGAEVPFLRPAEYATDTALDIDVFYHALTWLKEQENYVPELVVQLRPTYPIRNVADIDNMIETMLADPSIDSMRCIAPAKEIPHKMWLLGQEKDGDNAILTAEPGKALPIRPLLTDIPEAYNMPRQQLPKIYYQNACIDVIRSRVILSDRSMSGKNIQGYVMAENFDIDTEEEFARATEKLGILNGGKRFVFDIDGVIAGFRKGLDYDSAPPNTPMIEVINKLYDLGNEIILHTARGYVTGIDWSEVTKRQMRDWGVKYHELHFGKPNADYYVDDKSLDMQRLLEYFS